VDTLRGHLISCAILAVRTEFTYCYRSSGCPWKSVLASVRHSAPRRVEFLTNTKQLDIILNLVVTKGLRLWFYLQLAVSNPGELAVCRFPRSLPHGRPSIATSTSTDQTISIRAPFILHLAKPRDQPVTHLEQSFIQRFPRRVAYCQAPCTANSPTFSLDSPNVLVNLSVTKRQSPDVVYCYHNSDCRHGHCASLTLSNLSPSLFLRDNLLSIE